MTGFCIKCYIRLKWFNALRTNVLLENFPIDSTKMQLAGVATRGVH